MTTPTPEPDPLQRGARVIVSTPMLVKFSGTIDTPARGTVLSVTMVEPRTDRTKPEVPSSRDIVVVRLDPTGPDMGGIVYRERAAVMTLDQAFTDEEREAFASVATILDDAERIRRLHEEATTNAARYRIALEAVVRQIERGRHLDAADVAREALA